MAKYLIDANLPYYFSPWSGDDYRHVFEMSDRFKIVRVFQDRIEGIE